ncbi:MAG: hypothetical protein ABW061_04695 [Polyangiaceae bacterium]
MTPVDLIRIIGWSHLLQPPLTLLLATPRGVDLRGALVAKTALAREVMHNMAFASVGLPTALGLVLAAYPAEILRPGGTHAVGCLVAIFWCWRLYRQVFALRAVWPSTAARLNGVLTVIFIVQGPGLGWLLLR